MVCGVTACGGGGSDGTGGSAGSDASSAGGTGGGTGGTGGGTGGTGGGASGTGGTAGTGGSAGMSAGGAAGTAGSSGSGGSAGSGTGGTAGSAGTAGAAGNAGTSGAAGSSGTGGGAGADAGTDSGATDAGADSSTDGGSSQATCRVYFGGKLNDGGNGPALESAYLDPGGSPVVVGPGVILGDVAPDGTSIAVSTLGVSVVDGSVAFTRSLLETDSVYANAGAALDPNLDQVYWSVQYSPDGKWIAYVTNTAVDQDFRLFVVPAGGGAVRRLSLPAPAPSTDDGVLTVKWMPGASNTSAVVSWIVRDTADSGELYTADVVPVTPVVSTVIGVSDPGGPSFDGVEGALVNGAPKILFLYAPDGGGQITLMQADYDGSNRVPVQGTTGLVNNVGPADIVAFGVSRDGTKLAYAADATTDFLYQVFVKDLSDASAPVQVSNVSTLAPAANEPRGPAASYPMVWSPDGTKIAFLADWNLGGTTTDNQWAAYIVPSSGQGGTRLVELAAVGSNAPNVQPGLKAFAWCADSATLFLRGAYANATQAQLFGVTDFVTQDQNAAAVRLFEPVAADGLVTGLDVVE